MFNLFRKVIMTGYELSRKWFDFCFLNPEKIKPNHTALYFFAIEHCNRLGWKDKFGLPSTMTMEAIGIKSHNTYMKTFNELEEFGFIKVVERSKNQYSANIIALSNFDKALDKALDKAFIKHDTKQSESTIQSIDSIDKPITNKQDNSLNETDPSKIIINADEFLEMFNRARYHKDFKLNLPLNVDTGEQIPIKLSSLDKTNIIQLAKNQYTMKDATDAVIGLMRSNMDRVLKINPKHVLNEDQFIKYLDATRTGIKVEYDFNKPKQNGKL